jgi:hypothetical protein
LLTPQGKILFDFFVVAAEHGYFLDAAQAIAEDLVKRLTFYKLRSKVDIAYPVAGREIAAIWGAMKAPPPAISVYQDPRFPELGARLIAKRGGLAALAGELGCDVADEDDYHAHRIALGVPEGGRDYAYGDAFPHEACFDQLHGVDFDKGCYVGQEVVSRMEHRGTARKRIVIVEGAAAMPDGGADITAGSAVIGILGSVSGRKGIALVRLDRAAQALAAGHKILAGRSVLTISRPPWARYDVPVEGESGSA